MRRKQIVIISAIAIVIIGIYIWFKTPINMMGTNPEEIMEIVIFDGNTGNSVRTFDKEDISYIIENLNNIKLKREKLSSGYVGYSFKITIYGNDGEKIDGWNNFIINSKDTIRKDPFFYKVVEGSIDYQYIKDLVEKKNTKQELYDLIPMVMVKGKLYLDTGKESDINGRCGVMDGKITSTVEPFEKPTQDNQSNFGAGYEYQYVDENSIDIYMNGKWMRFEKEMDKAYDRINEYMKEESIAVFSSYYELLDFQISNYIEEVVDGDIEATFFYKIIHKNYDKDPDTVEYIKQAKESGNKNYQQMYDEYLEPKEMNFDLKVVIDKNDIITLYSNVSPNGIEWEETEMSDFILKK